MNIINQDRDELITVSEVRVQKHYYNNQFLGWNLYGFNNWDDQYLLGTFDSDHEAYLELLKLNNNNDAIKYITIYED